MNARNALAAGIAALRRDRGWTQANLAEVAGVSLQFVAALEQAAKTPSLDTVDALCAAFGVRASELFAAGEEPTPRKSAANKELLRAAAAVPVGFEKEGVELLHVLGRAAARSNRSTKKAR